MPLNQSVEQKGKELQKKVEEKINNTSNYIKQQGETITMRHLPGKDALLNKLLNNPSPFGIPLNQAPSKLSYFLLQIPPLTSLALNRLIENYYEKLLEDASKNPIKYYSDSGTSIVPSSPPVPSSGLLIGSYQIGPYPLPGGPIDKGKKK